MIYIFKSNLGKYLMQYTETYSRTLTRYQTLLENPSLLKKTRCFIRFTKRKIDIWSIKTNCIIRKELDFVKENAD